jgi:hypothetical protein
MKKYIALTLALLLLAGCAPAAYDGPTESAWVLTSLHTIHYDPEYGNETALVTYAYDSMGNQVRVTTHRNGEMLQEMKYQYDDRGNQIRRILWDHSGWFSFPVSRATYTYDDRNRPLTSVFRNGFGFKTGGDTYTYDDEANTVTLEGTYDTQTKYLNENGDPIRIVTISHAAGMEMETLYEYDELGRNVKTIHYQDGVLASTVQTSYDDQGRMVKNISYDANGTAIYGSTVVYEENTVTTMDLEGNRSVETLRPDGLVEKMENYNPDGELLSRMEYTYQEIQIPAKEE